MVNIITGTANGEIVYSESQQTSSGINGEIILEIGLGIPLLNEFNNIDWQQPNFISISFRPEGFGMLYSNNIVELLSVPYALFALKVTCIEGCPGPPGESFDCWDTNYNHVNDPQEDNNYDGIFDENDCPGPQGPPGPDGGDGAMGPQGPTSDIPGINRIRYLSIPPNNPMEGFYYIDDGTNRIDGIAGIRYFDGIIWIDL